MSVGFLWRGQRRGNVRNPYQPGKGPPRCSVPVPIDTYVQLCRIADLYDTSLRRALETVLADLLEVRP